MNTIMYYAGLIIAIICFTSGIIFFFTKKTHQAIRFLLKIKDKDIYSKSKISRVKPKKEKHENIQTNDYEQETDLLPTESSEKTAVLALVERSKTNLLTSVQNYAEALLDADNTSVLPQIDDESKLLF